MTDKHIFEFVEGQWQLSDLREISNENGCLPRNLVQQAHTILTGTYILQVSFVVFLIIVHIFYLRDSNIICRSSGMSIGRQNV